MRKMVSVLAAFACMLACCFALTACGGGDTAEADEFIGEWNLESVTAESDDMKVTTSDVALMQSFGYTATLTLNADGTAVFDMFGEVTECEWSVKDPISALLSIDGQKVDLTIDEKGILKMSQGGEEAIFFTKFDPEAAKEEAAQAAAADGAAADSASASSNTGQSTTGESSASTDSSSSTDSSAADSEGSDDSSASSESSATTDTATTAGGDSSSDSADDSSSE